VDLCGTYWAYLSESFACQREHQNAVLDMWNKKTQLASGKAEETTKTFKVLLYSFLAKRKGARVVFELLD
jgi:hypothetical protein